MDNNVPNTEVLLHWVLGQQALGEDEVASQSLRGGISSWGSIGDWGLDARIMGIGLDRFSALRAYSFGSLRTHGEKMVYKRNQ